MRTYDALYATYKGCYPALKATMHELRDQAEASREAASESLAPSEPKAASR